jgi:hypothetical protein
VSAAVLGLLTRAYYALAIDQDVRYDNLKRLANRVYEVYTSKTSKFGAERIPLPPYNELNNQVLRDLLDPQKGLPFAARAVLRTQLGLPAEAALPAPAPAEVNTNTAPPAATNAPAAP